MTDVDMLIDQSDDDERRLTLRRSHALACAFSNLWRGRNRQAEQNDVVLARGGDDEGGEICRPPMARETPGATVLPGPGQADQI